MFDNFASRANEENSPGIRDSYQSIGSSVKIDQAKNIIRRNSGKDNDLATKS